MITLLRVLAQNLLVLLRDAHLRSAEHRHATWSKVKDWLKLTLAVVGEMGLADAPEHAAVG